MTVSCSDIPATLLGEAKNAGCDAADVMVATSGSVTVDVRNSEVEHVERSESADIGLRVLINGRQACVSASDASPGALAELARRGGCDGKGNS